MHTGDSITNFTRNKDYSFWLSAEAGTSRSAESTADRVGGGEGGGGGDGGGGDPVEQEPSLPRPIDGWRVA